MNSIRTFSNNFGKTSDMWCWKRNQRLGMTFLQDRIMHLEFIHLPLIVCGFEKRPLYHVLFECNSNDRKNYKVPCLYSTFCLLLADSSSLVMQGEIMKRLQGPKQYNVKENKTLLAQGWRKVPLVQIRRDKSFQTGFLPVATLRRFQQLIQGPSAATLNRLLDIRIFSMTDTDTSTILIYIFRLTIPICEVCLVWNKLRYQYNLQTTVFLSKSASRKICLQGKIEPSGFSKFDDCVVVFLHCQ